ncbi:hypothetical protein TDB9533_04297 [Thalassocella blandensis]|nr:hypothetical protein TDB9533_04297 [Thalassocella blandensis]
MFKCRNALFWHLLPENACNPGATSTLNCDASQIKKQCGSLKVLSLVFLNNHLGVECNVLIVLRRLFFNDNYIEVLFYSAHVFTVLF